MIDIITPCYNDARYLPCAVGSVLAQTYFDWHLWLVDDSSEDHSSDIIAKFCALDERIAGLRLSENRGACLARIAAVCSIKERGEGEGEYVVFLDADDLISPDYLQMTLAAIGQAAYCYTDTVRILEKDGGFRSVPMPAYSVEWLQGRTKHPKLGPLMCSLMRWQAYDAVGGLNPSVSVGEDWVLYAGMAAAGLHGVHLALPLFWHRVQKRGEHNWAKRQAEWPAVKAKFMRLYFGGLP